MQLIILWLVCVQDSVYVFFGGSGILTLTLYWMFLVCSTVMAHVRKRAAAFRKRDDRILLAYTCNQNGNHVAVCAATHHSPHGMSSNQWW